MRKICYVSGTRADYGLMCSTLSKIQRHPELTLSICVTGMHLSALHGGTVTEIEKDGFDICARIPVDVESGSGAAMAKGIGAELMAMVDVFARERPDVVLLLGDRGEMLAGALAAVHLNIPVVHIHGGERSGTVDEPVRHAISKLAHWHFTATESARDRLIRMGERAEQIVVTGAPGLDGLESMSKTSRDTLCAQLGFDPERPVALVIFHPVLQEAAVAGDQIRALLSGVLSEPSLQAVCLMPNADAGSANVRGGLTTFRDDPRVRVLTHLPRAEFVSWMACVDVMIGNSSSGIIEAATFSTPVLDVGIRQNLRERSANVDHVDVDADLIARHVAQQLRRGRQPTVNVYGDGQAGARIVNGLATLRLGAEVLLKTNAY